VTPNINSPETKVPSLPTPQSPEKLLGALKELIEVREGVRGNELDANVTWRELVNSGIANIAYNGQRRSGSGGGLFGPGFTEEEDLTPPPQPQSLVATAGISNIILSWNVPTSSLVSVTEIWRSSTNVAPDVNGSIAVLVGTTEAFLYADDVGPGSGTRYYWVRFKTRYRVTGPYSAVASAETPAQVSQLLSALTGALTASQLNSIIIKADLFAIAPVTTDNTAADGSPFFYRTTATTINGVSVPAGAYMKSAFIHDAAITNAKIGNLAVDTAKIADGAIVTAKIGDAQITNAKIADASINSAKIADAAITNAKIGDVIQSNNYSAGSAGWLIDKNGTIYSQNLNSGAYTGYAWPAANAGGGFHASSAGVLMGSYHDNCWFQYDKNGKSFQFGAGGRYLSIGPGGISTDMNLSGATGTFSGTLTASAVNAVNTINIANNAIAAMSFSQDTSLAGTTINPYYSYTANSVYLNYASAAATGGTNTNRRTLHTVSALVYYSFLSAVQCSVEWSPNGSDWYYIDSAIASSLALEGTAMSMTFTFSEANGYTGGVLFRTRWTNPRDYGQFVVARVIYSVTGWWK
jgi:hypothetical protein